MKIRWSRAGLVLCAVYGAFAIPSLIYGYGFIGDFKGAYVVKQLAVFPAVVIAGLISPQFLIKIPDIVNNFFVFLFFSFILIYGVGLIFGISGNSYFQEFICSCEQNDIHGRRADNYVSQNTCSRRLFSSG